MKTRLLMTTVIGCLVGIVLQHVMILLHLSLFRPVDVLQFDASNPIHSLVANTHGQQWIFNIFWLFGIPSYLLAHFIAFFYRTPKVSIAKYVVAGTIGTLTGISLSTVVWIAIPTVILLHYIGYACAALLAALIVMTGANDQ